MPDIPIFNPTWEQENAFMGEHGEVSRNEANRKALHKLLTDEIDDLWTGDNSALIEAEACLIGVLEGLLTPHSFLTPI